MAFTFVAIHFVVSTVGSWTCVHLVTSTAETQSDKEFVLLRKHLVTDVDINATPTEVWAVLSDLAAYHEWNPFIVHAEGTAEVGARLTLQMVPEHGRAVTLRPRVLESQVGSRLRWRGKVGVRGILDADHLFTLEVRDGGTVHLRQEETFSGVLVPFVAPSLDRGTLPAFQAMNEALKQRVEQAFRP